VHAAAWLLENLFVRIGNCRWDDLPDRYRMVRIESGVKVHANDQ
jgi:hypothetical protein